MRSEYCRGIIASLLIASLAGAQTKPAVDNDKDAELPPAIQKAVAELSKEMEGVLKDPKTGTRRTNCDYFAKSKETIEPQALLDVLGRRLHKQVEVDAYIKWQLLSIQPGAFGDDVTKSAVQVYRRTPAPPPRPGAKGEEIAELNQSIASMKPDQKDLIDKRNIEWNEIHGLYFKKYGPMFLLRDELYARLPKNIDTIRAAFDDANTRIMGGHDTDGFLKKIAGDTRAVAAGLKPVEINQLAVMAQHLSGKAGPSMVTKLTPDRTGKKIYWQMRGVSFDKKICDQLSTDLTQMAKAGF